MVSENINEIIKSQFDKTLESTDFSSLGVFYKGKVRDNYIKDDIRIIIATDRLSAFDRVITTIPFKDSTGTNLHPAIDKRTNKVKNIFLLIFYLLHMCISPVLTLVTKFAG